MVADVHTKIGEQVHGVLRRQTQLLRNLVHPDLRHLCLSPADHSKPWSAPAKYFSSFIVALSMWYAFPKRPTCSGDARPRRCSSVDTLKILQRPGGDPPGLLLAQGDRQRPRQASTPEPPLDAGRVGTAVAPPAPANLPGVGLDPPGPPDEAEQLRLRATGTAGGTPALRPHRDAHGDAHRDALRGPLPIRHGAPSSAGYEASAPSNGPASGADPPGAAAEGGPDAARAGASRRRRASCATWLSLLMSIRQPVSRAASLAFWPSLPMARESWKSGTITSAVWVSGSMRTSFTFAGDSAFDTKREASSAHGMMSTFSPRSSLTTIRTLDPFGPTHAPTGSTLDSREVTAILLRCPASRATCLMSTMPSTISGTSSSNSFLMRLGCVREQMICGPRGERRTSTM